MTLPELTRPAAKCKYMKEYGKMSLLFPSFLSNFPTLPQGSAPVAQLDRASDYESEG